MTLPRRLALKLALSVLVAFVVVLIPLWFLQDYMAERDAYQEISETLENVLSDMDDQADAYLIRMAMTVRDAVKEMDDLSVPKLRALADSLGVDEICLVDANGILTHSARAEDIGLDFNKLGGQAAEFLCLLKDKTEFAQPFCQISLKDRNESRKYVGVWRPEGGFVQVGCLAPTLRALIQSELTGITHNWHIGAHGSGGHLADEVLDDLIADVRFQQRHADLTHSLLHIGFLQAALAAKLFEGGGNLFS